MVGSKMPDPNTNEMFLVVGVGGAAGLAGGTITALSETMTRKQVFATVFSSLILGSFVPPFLSVFWSFDWRVSGFIGLVLGLSCVAVVAGLKKLGDQFAKKPVTVVGAIIPQIRDVVEEDSPPITTGGGK